MPPNTVSLLDIEECHDTAAGRMVHIGGPTQQISDLRIM